MPFSLSFRQLAIIVFCISVMILLTGMIYTGVQSGLAADIPVFSYTTPFPEQDAGEYSFYVRGYLQGIPSTLLMVFAMYPWVKKRGVDNPA